MTDEVGGCFETSTADGGGSRIDLVADERLLLEVDQADMSVESVLFAELLIAGGIVGTGEVVFEPVVYLLVLF